MFICFNNVQLSQFLNKTIQNLFELYYLQPVRMSQSRPLPNPATFPRTEMSYARLRRFGSRNGKLFFPQESVGLSQSQQTEEQTQRRSGLRTFEVSHLKQFISSNSGLYMPKFSGLGTGP